ncbi:MAG: hypothetical protein AB7H71_00935 [Alphaproteobacteria bacterium]
MGACWYDTVNPNHYPLTPTWFHAITPISRFRMQPRQFPHANWNPDILALVTLAEFAATDWRNQADPGPPPDQETTNTEIDHLISLATTEREARMSEIIAQYSEHHLYYLGLLMVQRESHPATYLLLKIATRITSMTMAYFKYQYKRPRPVQYCPALMPPLDTTAHPSYPNGHALFGLMKSYCVADAVPEMLDPMLVLAERVWRNAEVGGFHFPSDAVASRKIADAAMPLLRTCPTYQDAVAAARQEWQVSLPSAGTASPPPSPATP